MRFALYITLLVALLPVIFTRPFIGLCVYYVISLLQPKFLCWQPEFQDAMLVGIPLVIGAVAIGARRFDLAPSRDPQSGRLLRLETRLNRPAPVQPTWALILFALLIGYIALTRLMVPYSIETSSYQFRALCKVLLVAALTTGLVTSPRHFRILFLVVALSTAFWAIKGGLKVIVLGPHQVYGKTYDNNLFALTSVMSLPMVFYYGLTVKHAKWRTVLLVCSALICLGIIGSRSRAGFMAFGVILACMAWSSRYRVRALVAVGLVAAVVAFMSGPEIWERVNSIFAYSEDQSARSRFYTWQVAWQLFLESPLIGVGFNNYEIAKNAIGGGEKSAHNIFLQNLSELGALGSPLWLAIIFGAMFGMFRLMRRARRLPSEMKWVYHCARGILLGLLGFCIHGFFHNEEYIELMFVLVALAATLRIVADRQWRELRLQSELSENEAARIVASGPPPVPSNSLSRISPTPAVVPVIAAPPRTLGELLRRNRFKARGDS
ncbi:MAG TPA: O-antigen ligase family protein [Phycisphaerae bacterium]|nr:O-antigen ligase family protein [Phycisphaerae bacterium]